MRKTVLLGMIFLMLSGAAGAETPQLSGVFPAVAPPGSTVTIIGGPYGRDTQVVFGERVLQPETIEQNRLTFAVPSLQEGDYLLYLRQGQVPSERSLFFRIALPAPTIIALTPLKIEACNTGQGDRVTVQGQDMQTGVQILLDGVALAAERSDGTLSLNLPELAPGLHQVQLVNPDGKRSLPVGLLVDAHPAIQSVSRHGENVNSYELLIAGKNFSYNSTLVVNGQPIAPFYPGSLQVDSITFLDCHTLLYKRYPPSSQPTRIDLQVVNPDGRESTIFTFTGP